MNLPKTPIDQIGVELHDLAAAYAKKAEGLASDPYFRAAVLKVSVSGFVWALYEAFGDQRTALEEELIEQTAAVSRAVRAN